MGSEEEDTEALAGCLRRVLGQPESWARMGAAGRAHVEANYDVRVLGERLARTYESILGHAAHPPA